METRTIVSVRAGACEAFLDVQDGTYRIVFLNGPAAAGLDEQGAYWYLTGPFGVSHVDAIIVLMDLDVLRGRELGLPFMIYDFENDEPLSDPLPYDEARRAWEELQATGEAPCGARLAPWGEDLDR